MTDKERIFFIIENGTPDDFLLCEAAVAAGSTWEHEYRAFKEHLVWSETVEPFLDLD